MIDLPRSTYYYQHKPANAAFSDHELALLCAGNTYNPGAEGTAAGMNNSQSIFAAGMRHKF